MGTVVYGSEIAKKIKAEMSAQIQEWKKEQRRLPKLTVVLVGHNPASMSYVRGKEKACIEIGMENNIVTLPETVTQQEVLQVIQDLNQDPGVDGILVQLPLPEQIDEHAILHAIDPAKDVDGFHPYNLGMTVLDENSFVSCTPKGIIRILDEIGMQDLSGKHAVVIGRSNIVGKPVSQLLLKRNATVTVCHSKTPNIEQFTSMADVLVVSVGKARLVNRNWVKEGAVVIDVGINRDENNKLCGDVDFDDVIDKVSYITPVPKGVGPMTITMLIENTLQSYRQREGI